ncbi:MAG: IS1595 family transposase [Micrococcaceae bacterium]
MTCLLSGIVEIDETFIGGKESNRHESKKINHGKRGAVNKTVVLGMKERNGNTKISVVPDRSHNTLKTAITANVEPDTLIVTDEWKSYKGIGYEHLSVNHSAKEFVDSIAHTNSIESVWAVLKRAFYGIYHSFTMKHTLNYVQEVQYRLNTKDNDYFQNFNELIGLSVGKRLTYQELIA